jgi:hypothetical protein
MNRIVTFVILFIYGVTNCSGEVIDQYVISKSTSPIELSGDSMYFKEDKFGNTWQMIDLPESKPFKFIAAITLVTVSIWGFSQQNSYGALSGILLFQFGLQELGSSTNSNFNKYRTQRIQKWD